MVRVALGLMLLLSGSARSSAQVAGPATLHGRVVDAQTGEPIGKALVRVPALGRETTTAADGTFALPDLPAGEVQLVVSTVGYGLFQKTVALEASALRLLIPLGQEALKRSEDVLVEAAPFEPADRAAPNAHTLGGVELRNLASVLVDDPLRSVQSLPGVAASDDFYASFATRGSGFGALGFQIDGVPTSAPFHTMLDANDAYSLTILNGDLVESLTFVGGAAPARSADARAAVLDVQTREGDREQLSGRASLGASGASATLEGPLGAAHSASWLVSARKSYLDYVLDRIDVGAMVVGYHDVTGRLSLRPASAQTLSLTLTHGRSSWQDRGSDVRPDGTAFATVAADHAALRWRYLPSDRLRLETTLFGSLDQGRNRTLAGSERFFSRSTQWGVRADALRTRGAHRLEAGAIFRGVANHTRDVDGPARALVVDESRADAGLWGGYLQDTWIAPGGRASITLGGRLDRFDETRETRLLPRASASVALTRTTRASLAFGEYAQFPALRQLHGLEGNPELRAERARHVVLALERSLGERTRLRVEAYDQDESLLLFARDGEWRMEDGRVAAPARDAALSNALDGRSRGIELLLQRRSVNGLSGWIAYALARARRSDDSTGLRFDSDFDQRHTLSAYASLRLSQTLNLSAKYRYGSGFPVAGFFRQLPDGRLFLADTRNALRAGVYSRLDLRANKTWIFRSWKLTLFGELLNVLDHANRRQTGFELDPRDGRVLFEHGGLIPLLPSVGLMADF